MERISLTFCTDLDHDELREFVECKARDRRDGLESQTLILWLVGQISFKEKKVMIPFVHNGHG